MDYFKGKSNYRSFYSEEEFDLLSQYYGLKKDYFEKIDVEETLEDLEIEMWKSIICVDVNGKTVLTNIKELADESRRSEKPSPENT